ncbi:hypothetical protein FRC12_005778 [Ceratobasidium sp. 428]|nr:hypothetical protein FRC12_005778 [Ceratobasidium sp. 428]
MPQVPDLEDQTISQLSDQQLTSAGFLGDGEFIRVYGTIKHTIEVARANPVLAGFVTFWMLDCQKARADHNAQQTPSPPTLSGTPTVFSQISVARLASEAVTVVGSHLLCEFERIHYYNGVSVDPPEIYYRSNIDTVKFNLAVPGQQNFFETPFKTAEGVLGTPIVKVWDEVAPLIVGLFKFAGVRYSALHPAFFSTLNEDMEKHTGPLVI